MARAVWVAPRLVKIFAGVGGGVFWGDVFPIALDDVGGCLVLMAPIVKPCGRTCAQHRQGQCCAAGAALVCEWRAACGN